MVTESGTATALWVKVRAIAISTPITRTTIRSQRGSPIRHPPPMTSCLSRRQPLIGPSLLTGSLTASCFLVLSPVPMEPAPQSPRRTQHRFLPLRRRKTRVLSAASTAHLVKNVTCEWRRRLAKSLRPLGREFPDSALQPWVWGTGLLRPGPLCRSMNRWTPLLTGLLLRIHH